MRGRTLLSPNNSALRKCPTYVQINIYNTDIKALKEEGLDIESLLKRTQFPSIIMNVPVINLEMVNQGFTTDPPKAPERTAEVDVETLVHNDNGLCGESSVIARGSTRRVFGTTNSPVRNDEDKIFEDCIHDYAEIGALDENAVNSDFFRPLNEREGEAGAEENFESNKHHQTVSFSRKKDAKKNGTPTPGGNGMEISTYMHTEDGDLKDWQIQDMNSTPTHEAAPGLNVSIALDASETKTVELIETTRKTSRRVPAVICRRRAGREKTFLCNFPDCTAKITLRPGYGKTRLVDHVRLHWNKMVKKCKLCGYLAASWKKVYVHHQHDHSQERFTGVISLETEEDMNELLEMWGRCFSDEFPVALLKNSST